MLCVICYVLHVCMYVYIYIFIYIYIEREREGEIIYGVACLTQLV